MLNDEQRNIAQACLDAAGNGSTTFPEIVGALMAAGYEGYAVDFRRGKVTYYHQAGGHTDLSEPIHGDPVANGFDREAIRAAIGEAQALAPGYTYSGFCRKVRAAGCAGYHVAFPGRRAVYYGKTGECHVEHFPR